MLAVRRKSKNIRFFLNTLSSAERRRIAWVGRRSAAMGQDGMETARVCDGSPALFRVTERRRPPRGRPERAWADGGRIRTIFAFSDVILGWQSNIITNQWPRSLSLSETKERLCFQDLQRFMTFQARFKRRCTKKVILFNGKPLWKMAACVGCRAYFLWAQT